jgi:hypothetical protein
MSIERRIHHGRGCVVATCLVAKLLRHRRPAAARLSGLLFVVITLIAQLHIQISSPGSHITVFNTSNIFHFGAVLLVAVILSAPWQALWQASLLLDLAGLTEVVYMLIVLWLARYRLASYQLVSSDWLWYTVLPLVSYFALIFAALLLPSQPIPALFVIAAATILLFIGIHNA